LGGLHGIIVENCIYKWNWPEFDSMDEIFEKTIGNEFSDLEQIFNVVMA